jgi:hypothetical protein
MIPVNLAPAADDTPSTNHVINRIPGTSGSSLLPKPAQGLS